MLRKVILVARTWPGATHECSYNWYNIIVWSSMPGLIWESLHSRFQLLKLMVHRSIHPSYAYMQRSSGEYTLRSVHCINSTNSEWSDVECNNNSDHGILSYICIHVHTTATLVIRSPSVNGCFWFTSRGHVMPFPQTLAQRYIVWYWAHHFNKFLLHSFSSILINYP